MTGKALKDNRIFPIFCIFASNSHHNYIGMKYYKVQFCISCDGDTPIQDARDILAAVAGDAGFEAFEDTELGVDGYVQTRLFDEEALKQQLGTFPMAGVSISYKVTETEDKDWNEQWENEGFEPITIGKDCVIHDGRHLPQGKFPVAIEIDARQAFGTGTHETTRMMVSALLTMPLGGKRVLDCGCGTGILGIAALKCGAESATGYDIDEWSVENSRHNAIINNVEERYESLLGDSSLLDGIEAKFDVIVANINRNILFNDMPRFRRMMSARGCILLSGFYTEGISILEEKAKSLGLTITDSANDNGWACIKLVNV